MYITTSLTQNRLTEWSCKYRFLYKIQCLNEQRSAPTAHDTRRRPRLRCGVPGQRRRQGSSNRTSAPSRVRKSYIMRQDKIAVVSTILPSPEIDFQQCMLGDEGRQSCSTYTEQLGVSCSVEEYGARSVSWLLDFNIDDKDEKWMNAEICKFSECHKQFTLPADTMYYPFSSAERRCECPSDEMRHQETKRLIDSVFLSRVRGPLSNGRTKERKQTEKNILKYEKYYKILKK